MYLTAVTHWNAFQYDLNIIQTVSLLQHNRSTQIAVGYRDVSLVKFHMLTQNKAFAPHKFNQAQPERDPL